MNPFRVALSPFGLALFFVLLLGGLVGELLAFLQVPA